MDKSILDALRQVSELFNSNSLTYLERQENGKSVYLAKVAGYIQAVLKEFKDANEGNQ
jgi:hypothetical protein